MMIRSATILAFAAATAAGQVELTTNGNFEAGDLSGWDDQFINGTFTLSNAANTGNFAGELFNDVEGTPSVLKQANIGIGQVDAGEQVEISFSVNTTFGVGGVLAVEFFSELDGGGVSQSDFLLNLTADTNGYQDFSFTVNAGPDVSGGVTLQFAAINGAVPGGFSSVLIDDVSVSIVPAPGAAALLGLGGLAAARRRRA